MRKVFIIAWNDLQIMLQNEQSWFHLLVLPALIIYLAGLGAQGLAHSALPSIRIDVLDRDASAASNAFVAALAEANTTLLICPTNNDPADACGLAGASLSPALAQERLANEVTFATLTIPAGFAAALEKGDEVTLVFQPGAALAAPEIAFGAVQNVVTRTGGAIVAARLSTEAVESLGIEAGPEFYAARLAEAEAAWGPVLSGSTEPVLSPAEGLAEAPVACTERSRSEGPPPPVRVVAELTQPNERMIIGVQVLENGFKLSTPSIAVMFVMISILGMTQSLAEERMMGILRRVGMMPISKAQLLGGKLLSTCLLGLSQFVILLVFGTLLGVNFGSAPLAVILVAGAYVLAVTAMSLALATLARTPQQASGIATFAWMVLTSLGGAWWPLALVPAWMQTLGHISPVAWCLDALYALIFYQERLPDVLGSVGALLLFAVVFFAFGVKRFSYQQSTTRGVTRVLPYL